MVLAYAQGRQARPKRRVNYDALLGVLQQRGITQKMIASADMQAEMIERAQILQAIVTPEEAIDAGIEIRYKDEFQTAKTAAVGIVEERKCDWVAQPYFAAPTGGATPTGNQQLGPSDMFIATFNDQPWCMMTVYDPNAAVAQWQYQWTHPNSAGTLTNQLKIQGMQSTLLHSVALSTQISPGGYSPHGNQLFCQRDQNDVRYQWCDGTVTPFNQAGAYNRSTIVVTVSVDPGATLAAYIELFRYNNGYPITAGSPGPQQITNGLQTYTFYVTKSDYYTVAIYGALNATLLNTSVYWTVTQTGTCSVLCHVPMKNIWIHREQLSRNGRVLALSCRMTDVSAYQWLQGEVALAKCLDGAAWYPMFEQGLQGGTACFDAVAAYQDVITGTLPEGGYMYHKPNKKPDFDWRSFVVLNPLDGTFQDVWVPLDSNMAVNVMACTTNNVAQGGAAGGGVGLGAQGYLTMANYIEYMTTDDWTPRMLPQQSSLAWRNSLEELPLFPDAAGNAWGWQDFITGIAKAVTWTAPMWRAAGKLGATALDTYLPGAGVAVNLATEAALDAAKRRANKRK